jgi:hypothetical protein
MVANHMPTVVYIDTLYVKPFAVDTLVIALGADQ